MSETQKLWRKNLIEIEPYTAGEQPKSDDIIKLNANENPYPPAPSVLTAIAATTGGQMSVYPSMDAMPLKTELAARLPEIYGVTLGTENIFIGNGSDDVLATAFRAFFNSGKPILFPDVTYSFYPVWCELLKIPYETPAVDENFEIDAEDYSRPNGGVVIANPNAPTSIGRSLEFIERILQLNQDCIVIVDEAYIDFAAPSSGVRTALPLLEKYENLIITQTFSKSRSMAGMRIGTAYGSAELIGKLYAVKDSYNSYPLDNVAIAAGAASVRDVGYFREKIRDVVSTRDRTAEALRGLGFKVADSSTNFLFAEHERLTAEEIFAHLRGRGIYVRYWKKPRIGNRLRITIGTDEQMDKLLAAVKEIV